MKEQTSNELVLRTNAYLTTLVGTEILRPSTKSEWTNYGEILKRIDEVKQWAIGDWLLDGMNHFENEHEKNKKYSGTGLYEEAEKISNLNIGTLMNRKQVSSNFEIRTRNINLTWTHYKEVSSLKSIIKDKKT